MWGKPGCVWSANHYEKYDRTAAEEKLERETPRKKPVPLGGVGLLLISAELGCARLGLIQLGNIWQERI